MPNANPESLAWCWCSASSRDYFARADDFKWPIQNNIQTNYTCVPIILQMANTANTQCKSKLCPNYQNIENISIIQQMKPQNISWLLSKQVLISHTHTTDEKATNVVCKIVYFRFTFYHMWEVVFILIIGQTKCRSVLLCHRKTRVTIWYTAMFGHVWQFDRPPHMAFMAIWYTFALEHDPLEDAQSPSKTSRSPTKQ